MPRLPAISLLPAACLAVALACAGGPARHPKAPPEVPGMVYIPAGPFLMGSDDGFDDEAPAHRVVLPGYYIDRQEVTVGEYRRFARAAGREVPRAVGHALSGRDELPVVDVTWEEARDYCEWAGKRLPTEAEWEKAARGTDGRRYPWGNEPPYHGGRHWACYAATLFHNPVYPRIVPGDFYATDRSPYGVLDMAGNVAEWTASTYDPYPGNAFSSPLFGKGLHVIRGGSWRSSAELLRVTRRRVASVAGYHRNDVGFRCVRDGGG
ncbi:MAG: hypothetical protein D6739_12720 [Nitrospirae bacterium]|nr:MAG: hypothetical protein D6739_12720 [Nitrospirota bacterium]